MVVATGWVEKVEEQHESRYTMTFGDNSPRASSPPDKPFIRFPEGSWVETGAHHTSNAGVVLAQGVQETGVSQAGQGRPHLNSSSPVSSISLHCLLRMNLALAIEHISLTE